MGIKKTQIIKNPIHRHEPYMTKEEQQKELGELILSDIDEPSKWDLLGVTVIVGFILYGTFAGWW